MKLTIALYKQNVHRMMKNQFKVARKRKVLETTALKHCEANNIDVIDANEFVANVKPTFDFSSVVGLAPRTLELNENHPLYKEKPCYKYQDSMVLVEGLHQALVATNTVQISDKLPLDVDKLVEKELLPNQNNLVKRCIYTSCVFDATQTKLPTRKDPNRPSWGFPNDYGITDVLKNRMMCSRLLHLCALASPSVSAQRAVLHNVPLSVPLQIDDENVQLELRSDVFVSAEKPLPPILSPSELKAQPIQELVISHPLISFVEDNFYELKNIFPLEEGARFSRVHTIVVHYNNTQVSNIYETPVTETQKLSWSLMKAFTAAAAQAQYTFGPSVKDLPEPIVVQCVQTDGKSFHFSVLQLNSLDLKSSQCNAYWSLPPIDMYEDCSYLKGVPNLSGYNPEVFQTLLALYLNSS